MKISTVCRHLCRLQLLLLIIISFFATAVAEEQVLGVGSTRSMHNLYQARMMVGIELFARNHQTTSLFLTSGGDSERQLRDIMKVLEKTKGKAVFFVDPNDEDTAHRLADYFEENEVYWVSTWNKPVDVKVWEYDYWVCHFSYDSVAAGKYTAQRIVEYLGGKGKMLVLRGMDANSSSVDRVYGLNSVVVDYPEVKIVGSYACNWSREEAYLKTIDYLKMHPDLSVVWAANDTMALGALDAIREAGRVGEIQVSGVDGGLEMLQAIRRGDALCTVYNNAVYQAGIGITMAYEAYMKHFKPSQLERRYRQFYALGLDVDQSNVEAVIKTYFAHIPDYNFHDYFSAFSRKME